MSWVDISAWDFGSMLKTIFGAGIGTALAQTLFKFFQDTRVKEAQAAYLALRLAIALEDYAGRCLQFTEENGNAPTDPAREYPDWDVALPTLQVDLEDTEGWRAIDRSLANDCLGFPHQISSAQRRIYATIDFSDDELGDVLDREAALLGKEAWRIATELRNRYPIGSSNLDVAVVERCDRIVDQAQNNIGKIRRRNAAIFNADG